MSGVFGPSVGGGFLAAAGALGGLGKGISDTGELMAKQQLMQQQNDLETARETKIAQLQEEYQSGENQKQREFQEGQTQKELAARSSVAQFEVAHKESEGQRNRDFTAAQNAAKLKSEETRTGISASARVLAAGERSGGSSAGANRPEWTYKSVSEPVDPKNPMTGGVTSRLIAIHRSGQQYLQVGGSIGPDGKPTGGKMVPYDSNSGAPQDLGKYPRPGADIVSDLITNPDPAHAAAFQSKFGYLPGEYLAARDQALQQQKQPSGNQLPITNLFKPGSRITKTVTIGGGGGNSTEEMQDNTDNQPEAPSEADTAVPSNQLE